MQTLAIQAPTAHDLTNPVVVASHSHAEPDLTADWLLNLTGLDPGGQTLTYEVRRTAGGVTYRGKPTTDIVPADSVNIERKIEGLSLRQDSTYELLVESTNAGDLAVSVAAELKEGGSPSVTAEDVAEHLTFSFPRSGSQVHSSNIVQLKAGTSGPITVSFDLDNVIPDGDTVNTIGMPTITNSGATVGLARLNTSRRKVNVELTQLGYQSAYHITLPFTTTGGQSQEVTGVLSLV